MILSRSTIYFGLSGKLTLQGAILQNIQPFAIFIEKNFNFLWQLKKNAYLFTQLIENRTLGKATPK